jgi:serine/threonine protein kinase
VANRVARTIGRYEVLEELGRGAMASVYLARQVDLDRLVALKELSVLGQTDAAHVQRFLRESRLAASLGHPNIVTVHEYFEWGGTPYIAMEYVEGGSLRPYVGHLGLTQICGVLQGVLAALAHAETHHIVHRDMKPENVMVTSDGRVKLTDFGMAKATGAAYASSLLTAVGSTVGTPNYMAPEQAMGREVGPWTDLYAVGVMAYELFVGSVPFADTEAPMAVLMRQVNDAIPPARTRNPDLAPGISDWLDQLLVKEPQRRVQTAAAAWDALEEVALDVAGPRWARSSLLPPTPPRSPPKVATARRARARYTPAGRSTAFASRTHRTPERHATTTGAGTRAPTLTAPVDDALGSAPTQAPITPPDAAQSDERPSRRRGWHALAVLASIAAMGLAAVAFAAEVGAPDLRDDPVRGASAARVAPLVTSVTSHRLALRFPRGWSPVRHAPGLGLALADSAVVAPKRSPAGRSVTFGIVRGHRADNGALLPERFLDRIGQAAGTTPARERVRLPAQRLQAWRYTNLRPGTGDRSLTVYTVPTTNGVAVVACSAPTALANRFARDCGRVAGSLRLLRARSYPVGPSPLYAATLSAALGVLRQATTSDEASLRAAQSLAGQAAAAGALADDYAIAAEQLEAVSVSPADRTLNEQLSTALAQAADVYRAASRAATAGHARPYLAASAGIPRAKANVNAALAQVTAAGYDVQTATAHSEDATATTPTADGEDEQSDDPSDDSSDP